MFKVVTIGEAVVQFSPFIDDSGEPCFKQGLGGAPANVAVQASILGAETFFIGKSGNDSFGHFIKDSLIRYNVDTKGLLLDKQNATSIMFSELDEKNKKCCKYYNIQGAEANLKYEDVNLSIIDSCDIFYFGSFSLINETSRIAVTKALAYSKEKRKTITYDPNYRASLWSSEKEAVSVMKSVLDKIDIIKVSEEELKILTGCDKFVQGIADLLKTGIRVVIVTQGPKGCIVASRSGIQTLRTYKVDSIDKSGAGDSFFGAFIYKLAQSNKHILDVTLEELLEFSDFANACGALSSTKKGTISAMPNKEAIEDCVSLCEKL